MRKVTSMIRPPIAIFAVLIALGSSAAAQNAIPALKASATVTNDVVRIGDLVENAGPVADVPIFRAPDLGTTGAVATNRVVEAIRPHQLIDIDTRGIVEVVVTRSSRAIAAPEISARIAQALAGQYGLGTAHNIMVNFDREVHTLQVEPNVTGDLQVAALAYDPRTTRFDVTFDIPSSAELRRQATRYTGTAIETVNTVAVDHPVERGEVLKASDLTILRRPKTDGGAINDISAVAGLAARHQLHPGQPLTSADVMKPEIMQRNDNVTIVYEAPGLKLTMRGQSQDVGGLGDTINVLNIQSKRVVQGVVAGPGRVTVNSLTTRFVENSPQAAAVAGTAPVESTE
jgi:flagellar basal body P-ring formation protein FlgA